MPNPPIWGMMRMVDEFFPRGTILVPLLVATFTLLSDVWKYAADAVALQPWKDLLEVKTSEW